MLFKSHSEPGDGPYQAYFYRGENRDLSGGLPDLPKTKLVNHKPQTPALSSGWSS